MKQVSAILLTLPDGRLIFQRRTQDAPSDAGLLGLFGGYTEGAETPDETMIREFGEEVSLELDKLVWGYITQFAHTGKGGEVTYNLYWAEVPHDRFEVYEGDGSEVYTRSESLGRSDLAPPARHVIENILKEK